MNILSALFLPIYCIGWLVGFIANPFINGFSDGVYYLDHIQMKKYLEKIKEIKNKKTF